MIHAIFIIIYWILGVHIIGFIPAWITIAINNDLNNTDVLPGKLIFFSWLIVTLGIVVLILASAKFIYSKIKIPRILTHPSFKHFKKQNELQ